MTSSTVAGSFRGPRVLVVDCVSLDCVCLGLGSDLDGMSYVLRRAM
jgi:hypothetical protein